MKRVADDMDRGDTRRSDRNSNRSGNTADHKRMRCVDERHNGIGNACATVKTLADEKETDPHRLAQRQKQIDYGKNTIGYDRYCTQVPRRQRRPGKHPMTPDKTMRIGKKVFDGIVRKWRQALHKYDPPELVEATKAMVSDDTIAVTVDAMTEVVDAGAMNVKSVKSEEGAATTSSCDSTASTKSDVKKMPTESKPTLPSRSIYENFDEDNFDDDSDDDLL